MENERVKIIKTVVLSDNYYVLKKVTFDFLRNDGSWQSQTREVYDRGNAAAILLYNKVNKTVILINQFRLPAYLNGNETGILIETCAGMLDKDSPEECIKREIEEETGYKISVVRKVFEAYMSPGSLTEVIHFFVAEYSKYDKVSEGGGLEHEGEDLAVFEIPFDQAYEMIKRTEIKDAKTILLLQYAKLHNLL